MKEIEVGAFEAKNQLSALLDQAAKGQRIWITKRGKRIALLSSAAEAGAAPEDQDRMLARFRKVRRSTRKGPQSLKSLIEEGRR